MKKSIELLAPARNLNIGIEAIRHGADAVYIGADSFGARSAAGNSIEDIQALTEFAHRFHAKVYVTLNTILTDAELDEAQRLIEKLYAIGVDALIIQDLGLLQLDLPPIDLHASTQMDNVDAEKVKFLEQVGFSQVVLARELSLQQISAIHSQSNVALEAFVHGALCVSYSGRCYASQHCFSRSANKGCCAQFCRLPFDLIDGKGTTVMREKHLLSLRDMNRSQSIEEMIDAGITSFKIEGRLKDEVYVKNVTAAYRQAIDAVISQRPDELQRSSHGESTFTFTPNLSKSFNRGFTDYFIRGERSAMHDFDTPKSKGELIGEVAHVERDGIRLINCKENISAGDGLTFIDASGKLQGFRVNKVENGKIFPHIMPGIKQGSAIWRNHDERFLKLLSRPSAERRIAIEMRFEETADGFQITATDDYGCCAISSFPFEKVEARSPQEENIRKQFSRLGDTIFCLRSMDVKTVGNHFIPSSTLATWRRAVIEKLLMQREKARPVVRCRQEDVSAQLPQKEYNYTANISNRKAAEFYERHGARSIAPAYELAPTEGAPLMYTRHCLRHALGCCLKTPGGKRLTEPLTLRLTDGRAFTLKFHCDRCEMSLCPKNPHL